MDSSKKLFTTLTAVLEELFDTKSPKVVQDSIAIADKTLRKLMRTITKLSVNVGPEEARKLKALKGKAYQSLVVKVEKSNKRSSALQEEDIDIDDILARNCDGYRDEEQRSPRRRLLVWKV